MLQYTPALRHRLPALSPSYARKQLPEGVLPWGEELE